jgi:adenylosuccinate lyase
MSGEIINLNKARKARDKAAKDAQAAQNRAGFGRTKGEKAKAMSIAEKVKQVLDDAKRDRDPK